MTTEFDSIKPNNYSLGDKATFENTKCGCWIASKSNTERPLEVINKKKEKINFWDWEPNKLLQNYLMTKEEFDQGDYFHLIIGR